MQHTSIADIEKSHAVLHDTFLSGLTLPIEFRQRQLLAIAQLVQDHHERFIRAVNADLGKPALEAYAAELQPIVERSIITATKLKEWAAPEVKTIDTPWQKNWTARVFHEPKGVGLIIVPWNYPIILLFQPLIGAIAAGCCCLVKPSEFSPHVSALAAELIPKYLDERAYRVVCGGIPEITKVLELKWDQIFYTGHGIVARIVSRAAAKHLTPCVLELGGKNPVIVDPKYPDVDLAAKRILYGKCTNAGQICVSPDYVLLPASLKTQFLDGLKKAAAEFFPDGALGSDSISRIVNNGHFERVTKLIADTKGQIIFGGNSNSKTLKIEPTVVLFEGGEEQWRDDSLMQGENFGPILPIVLLPDDDVDGALRVVRSRDHPLVLYVFSEDEELRERVRATTRSGNLIFNDTVMQLAVNELPFGGVGESGYGRQCLRYTYDIFTYQRASLDIPRTDEHIIKSRYAPFTEDKVAGMRDSIFMKIPDVSKL